MPQDTQGVHHHHHRKNKSPFPEEWTKRIDVCVLVVGVMGPILTIPQLLSIWINKDATGVSLISWFSYFFIACFWLLYGLVHRSKPIIVTNALWIFLDTLIVTGILLYS